jgi:hypothetical protein
LSFVFLSCRRAAKPPHGRRTGPLPPRLPDGPINQKSARRRRRATGR